MISKHLANLEAGSVKHAFIREKDKKNGLANIAMISVGLFLLPTSELIFV